VLPREQKCLNYVVCWAKKALILCRSSFLTLSGTDAAREKDTVTIYYFFRPSVSALLCLSATRFAACFKPCNNIPFGSHTVSTRFATILEKGNKQTLHISFPATLVIEHQTHLSEKVEKVWTAPASSWGSMLDVLLIPNHFLCIYEQ